ncbi:hypothetical protein [Tsuneonella mangrovi]|uniref:hypothetical protein n=1 Tax=Tsuneonella mangrovi TaxID=1982042 RepID=UPI0012378B5E|nr:hypothetical protein [Tsuneonella mangrovi]
MIAFEVKSWGAPANRWQYGPNYGGVWVEVISEPTDRLGSYTLAFHPIAANRDRYLMLEAIVDRLPAEIPVFEGCKRKMTDMPYGTLRLTRGAVTKEIAWKSGCMDDEYVQFMDTLKEADRMVTDWGKMAPASRTEEHRIE